MLAPEDYRSRIYARYATNFQDAPAIFDADAAWHWGRAYRHYLKNWKSNNKNEANKMDEKMRYLFGLRNFDRIEGYGLKTMVDGIVCVLLAEFMASSLSGFVHNSLI